MRVVVVDDEPDIVTLLRVQLTAAGFDVVGEAGDGRRALEVVRETTPDAVVLDLLMPTMTGFEAIPELRSLPTPPHIVAYTAVAGDFVRQEMKRLRVPLVLKSGVAEPLVAALRAGPAEGSPGA